MAIPRQSNGPCRSIEHGCRSELSSSVLLAVSHPLMLLFREDPNRVQVARTCGHGARAPNGIACPVPSEHPSYHDRIGSSGRQDIAHHPPVLGPACDVLQLACQLPRIARRQRGGDNRGSRSSPVGALGYIREAGAVGLERLLVARWI